MVSQHGCLHLRGSARMLLQVTTAVNGAENQSDELDKQPAMPSIEPTDSLLNDTTPDDVAVVERRWSR